MLGKTYKVAEGPPAPSFEHYAATATDEFRSLIDSNPGEAAVQRFLERNPCFVPGATYPGSHGPLHDALISQPKLPGLSERLPDFLWITKHSSTLFPVLIEIERPGKRIFKANGVPSSEFTQARHQLTEWRAWFADPVNVLKFFAEYGVPDGWHRDHSLQVRFILVMGRRSEFSDDPVRQRNLAGLLPAHDEDLMSYDRLAPEPALCHGITVRAKGGGRYQVQQIMPTLKHDPMGAGRLLYIEGFDEAIRSEARMTPERRRFLSERVPYWTDWAKSPLRGIIGPDSE
jgi:hypothetical protein